MTEPRAGAQARGWLEPDGATPLEPDELVGLIPTFIATRDDLNVAEFDAIARALPSVMDDARMSNPLSVLDRAFLFDLHRQMFEPVWKWAGQQRRRETNLGVPPHQIGTQVEASLADARFWHEHETFDHEEIAARTHHRLVTVHPFPNGNGRATRLIADCYLRSLGLEIFTWGTVDLSDPTPRREEYLQALRAADDGDVGPLIRFARS